MKWSHTAAPWHLRTVETPRKSRAHACERELSLEEREMYEIIGGKMLRQMNYNRFSLLKNLRRLGFKSYLALLSVFFPEPVTSRIRCLSRLPETIAGEWRYTANVRRWVAIRKIHECFESVKPSRRNPDRTSPRVVYLTGMPRSGTSLSKNFLGDHPGLSVLRFQKTGFPVAWRAAQKTDHIIIDKATHYIRNVERIYRCYGDSVVFFCVIRDPRDTLTSIVETSRHREIHRDSGFWKQWHDYYNVYIQFAESLGQPMSTFHILRYEDLVRYPETAKRSFLAALNIPVRREELSASYRILREGDIQDWKLENHTAINTHSIGRWRRVEEKRLVELLNEWKRMKTVGSLMHQFGYEDFGCVSPSIGFKNLKLFDPDM